MKNITDYGAFIDLGGRRVAVIKICRGAASATSELFKVNDEIDVIVLSTIRRRSGFARTQTAHHRPLGERDGAVPRSARAGGRSPDRLRRVVELESGVEADPRVEMSEQARQAPVEILNVGDTVDAMVLGVTTAQRISLGLNGSSSPGTIWPTSISRFEDSARCETSPSSAPVEVEEDIDGLIHPDMSWASGSSIRRSPEEGRCRRGHGAEHRRREPAAVARRKRSPPISGTTLHAPPRGRQSRARSSG